MPKWGLAMQEGTLRAWYVEPGAAVEGGTPLCEIETAKITNEFEAPAAGIVARLQVSPGDVVAVGRVIAVLADADTPAAAIEAALAAETSRQVENAEPTAIGLRKVATQVGELACLDAGDPGAREAVVLLHGWAGDHRGWTLVQPALAASHRTIAFDLPGHGQSTRFVGDGSAESLAAIISDALLTLRIEQAWLVAHSFGAAVAGALVRLRSDLVGAISLLAPVDFGTAPNMNYVEGFLAAQRKRDMRPVLEMLFAAPALAGREMVADALRMLRDDAARAALRHIADNMPRAGSGAAQVPPWAKGRPLHVIWGAEDRIVPLPDGLNAQLGDRLHVIAACGHIPQIEAADCVTRLLLQHVGA
jgi:pyruvate dehydrogenase E2 component (dihydrolipoamide acetyltransferase)